MKPHMHKYVDLKKFISVSNIKVECPVKECDKKVDRQRNHFLRDEIFQCPTHRIYISPSTFEYPNDMDNLLWTSSDDVRLLAGVMSVKRESRMARDNSEDAVTWNVFRYLERTNLLSRFLSSFADHVVKDAKLIYWSYSQEDQGTWPDLMRSREEFCEDPKRSSEPDLIAVSERAIFWIEAKLTASNKTTPSNPLAVKGYLTGGGEWHRRVFTNDFKPIAILSKLYELYRFWLLGTWAASQAGRDFYLINLVRSDRDLDIEKRFGPYIRQGPSGIFRRFTWEDIYRRISLIGDPGPEKDIIMDYFLGKTIGYNAKRELQLAFNLS